MQTYPIELLKSPGRFNEFLIEKSPSLGSNPNLK
jgi:hypothetical protein